MASLAAGDPAAVVGGEPALAMQLERHADGRRLSLRMERIDLNLDAYRGFARGAGRGGLDGTAAWRPRACTAARAAFDLERGWRIPMPARFRKRRPRSRRARSARRPATGRAAGSSSMRPRPSARRLALRPGRRQPARSKSWPRHGVLDLIPGRATDQCDSDARQLCSRRGRRSSSPRRGSASSMRSEPSTACTDATSGQPSPVPSTPERRPARTHPRPACLPIRAAPVDRVE